MIQSSGVLTKTPSTTIWQGSPSNWPHTLNLGFRWASYSQLYKSHPFLAAGINKIANAGARLPLKVYERDDEDSRAVAPDTPYAVLLRRPNRLHDPFLFWSWTFSTLMIYGEAFWAKFRDAGGRPVELAPMHPTNVHDEDRDGTTRWSFDNGTMRVTNIDRRDLVHFRFYNPDSLARGLSLLEPLRSTLENEEGARRANSALWRNGGRPSVFLTHPATLSDPAAKRLTASWNDLHSGVDNWAKAALLEEGMKAETVALNVEELQYIAARELNRDEVLSVIDVPPPAVHDLRRATFSNVTEQNRSLYRDTMPPKLKLVESTMEFELRDGRFGADREPDFGDNVYAEFLMDEVLRGDFEVRVPAIAQAIQTGQLTPNEGRRIENRPAVDGGDKLLINAALVAVKPDDGAAASMTVPELTRALQQIYLSVGSVISPEEAREILNRAGAGLAPGPLELVPAASLRSVMGRLSRVESIDTVDPDVLTAGLDGETDIVRRALAAAQMEGITVPEFRDRLKALGRGE